MIRASRLTGLAVLVALVSLAPACAWFAPEPTGPPVLPPDLHPAERIPTPQEAPEMTEDGLVRVRAPELRGAVYVKPPRPNLQQYQSMMLIDSVLTYRKGVKGWDSETERTLKAYLQSKLEEEIYRPGTWARSEVPGDGVLLVRAGAVELDIDISGPPPGSNTVYRSGGGVVLVIDMRDSVTNEALLRFAQRRELPSGNFSGWDIESSRLRRTMDVFARDLGDMLETFGAATRRIEEQEAN